MILKCFRMGDEEVQSAMDVIEDKRDAARDAFEDLCMTVDKLIEEKAEKQEAARARWEHQSARGSWSHDLILTSDWSGSSI